MSHKSESELNQGAIEFANNPNMQVAPSLRKKIGNVVMSGLLSAGMFVGLGKAGENDLTAEKMTDQNNEQIFDQAQITQESTPTPQKGGDGALVKGGQEDVDIANGVSMTIEDPVLRDNEAELPFVPGNDGAASVETERQANNPEG